MVIFDGLPISPDKSYLREELATIDESWTAARFDSLSNVVHILTSKDREGEIQKIKDQSDVIEEVVDEVVHAYHGGFIKAIQNYSQILRLFSESTESISVLKVDLAESKKRLGTRNKQLHQLLYCSTLRHIISLLDQVENIAKALVAFTTEHEHLFTPAEYAILLKVRVREMPTIEYQQSCPVSHF